MKMEKETKIEKMVLKHHYDQLPLSNKLAVRDEFVKLSGVSMITFYQKMRNDTFKPLDYTIGIENLSGVFLYEKHPAGKESQPDEVRACAKSMWLSLV